MEIETMNSVGNPYQDTVELTILAIASLALICIYGAKHAKIFKIGIKTT